MDIVARAQNIILKPNQEWGKIKAEKATVSDIFKSYLMIIAAIPAIAQFLGYWLVGIRLPFRGHVRMSFGFSLGRAIVSYILLLAAIYILALIIKALAPSFLSKPDLINALKLATYSMTAYLVAGIFYIIPALSILVLVAGLYSLYVFYLGFKASLMETPPEKITGYFVVTIIVTIGLLLVANLIAGTIFSLGTFYSGL